MQNLKEIIVN